MKILVAPEIEQMIRARIDTGEYSQPEEVVAEALRVLEVVAPVRRTMFDESISIEELRALIHEGIESSNTEGCSPADEVIAKLRRDRQSH